MKNEIDIDELAVQLRNLCYQWAMLKGEKDFIVLEQLQEACKESPFHILKESMKGGFDEGLWDRMTKDKKVKKRLEELDYPEFKKDKGPSR